MKSSNRGFWSALLSSWYLWLFPLFAIIISAWLFRDHLNQQGPKIEISFEDAANIQEQKTRIKFRGVEIGVVEDISIAPDGASVLTRVQLKKNAAHFAVEGSKFWVVSPKVGLQGISGLETIIQGTYIAVQPGPKDAESKVFFKGSLDDDEDSDENTRVYYIEADNAESIGENDAVTFRGMKIGFVSNVRLSKTGQSIIIQVRVHRKHARVVRTNTFFWRKFGIQAKLGLFDSKVTVNSFDSILHGGLEIFTPDPAGPMANSKSKFVLASSPPKGYETWNPVLEAH